MASDEFTTLIEPHHGELRAARANAGLSAAELRDGMELVAGVVPPLDGTTVEPLDVGGVPCEWVRPAAAVANDACVLYLHGGGYVIGSCNTHRALASHLAGRTGLPVLVVDYRLAPEHAYPAALDDALIAYEWLLDPGLRSRSHRRVRRLGGRRAHPRDPARAARSRPAVAGIRRSDLAVDRSHPLGRRR